MLPSKFGSVRQKQPERRTSLRLDPSIVALRYEKTIPAEPPILIVSRDPTRLSRRPSSSSASSHSSRHRPIVIVPPGIVAPPAEEHPALRGSSSSSSSSSSTPTLRTSPVSVEEWKRDSGVARNKSTSTIHEEEDEDGHSEPECKNKIPAVESNASSLVSSVMPQPSTTTQRDEDPFVDENSIFEPLTSIPTDPFCVVYNARCTTPPPPPQVSHSDTPLPLPAPATPTRPSRTTASTVPFSIPYSECLAGKVPSSPTYPPLSGSRSHKSPCSSLPSSPRTSCSSSPPTISKGISRSGSSRFGTFSQMFNTPIQPLWRGTASTANSSASSTPTVSAQSTITTALGATANATVNAPATDADTAIDLAESGSLPSDKEQGSSRFWNRSRSASTTSNNSTSTATLAGTTTILSNNDLPFVPLDVSIPCESLLDDAFMNTVSFSNRGSIMLGAQDAAAIDGAIKQHTMSIDSSSSTSTSTNADTFATRNNDESDSGRATPTPTPSTTAPRSITPTPTTPTTPKSQTLPRPSDESNDMNNSVKGAGDGSPQGLMSTPDIRVLAADVEKESQKCSKSPFSGLANARIWKFFFPAWPTDSNQEGFRKVAQHTNIRIISINIASLISITPSLQDIVDEIQAEKLTEVMKRKEWERSEKWRKMAKVVRRGGEGEGMEFEFDMRNPKLIERTWKGIPDRWRGAAWWSFMATSAREHEGSPSEERIVAEFHRLQRRSSPDDVQIDLDVPRTISRHIMFRRRYRGGQRLLFRVLHAISIYYPETGYVQGMASLAATLLCYFDEEKCFVMLVRMWHLRGLARLYRPGFEELMAAMGDFSKHWLNKEVASKLDELCIDTTAYGTRWYLTLFNLSVPFPAQLRIWDVFLLLGNDQPSMSESRKSESNTPQTGEYDVLHATSAALAQALREVLLDAEFENAMKALTSSIPVKDEDLLMKVVKAEYKQHHGKKKT
ncbi:hypothetical protein HZS61_012029 [Fusarium oxysporum f. sp. conglutinans]|uniref:Rab-GAP TBC domain-containing protein n=1 Tax=Fusarium oxysporum f. sp. conglutinans TaxID=100902 RepID=A0A8H6GUF2_FUSOX|nr:hypothetical protein HZS61_012029 [Fusarium oxysporum f. sp. conglutinans]